METPHANSSFNNLLSSKSSTFIFFIFYCLVDREILIRTYVLRFGRRTKCWIMGVSRSSGLDLTRNPRDTSKGCVFLKNDLRLRHLTELVKKKGWKLYHLLDIEDLSHLKNHSGKKREIQKVFVL